jgi:peptide methionine sulfoxide reductase MsrA
VRGGTSVPDTIFFAGGGFFLLETIFLQLDRNIIISVEGGYAGDNTRHPIHKKIGSCTEMVKVEFHHHPPHLRYLLDVFFCLQALVQQNAAILDVAEWNRSIIAADEKHEDNKIFAACALKAQLKTEWMEVIRLPDAAQDFVLRSPFDRRGRYRRQDRNPTALIGQIVPELTEKLLARCLA